LRVWKNIKAKEIKKPILERDWQQRRTDSIPNHSVGIYKTIIEEKIKYPESPMSG